MKFSARPNQIISRFKKSLAIVGMVALASGSDVRAEHPTTSLDHPPSRARYASRDDDSSLRFTPVMLADGSRLTLISPRYWSDVSEEISLEVVRTHQHLTKLFGAIPPFRSSVRLLDERAFYELTGAPGWTNAMFFRGEIIIPLSPSQPVDLENIRRSVKHEYSHAVLSALSGGQIPGWLDEGLAQWIEGDENPALRATLKSYLKRAQPVPLALLQGGFTKLSPQMVPAAYAQSLLAVQALIKAYGITKFSEYLSALRGEEDKDLAFENTFGINLGEFEQRLSNTLIRWARPNGNAAPELRAASHSHR
ncbi:MAG: peptidase MA family metallohydrolase [Pseudomonadota bacterium]